jgi:integrase
MLAKSKGFTAEWVQNFLGHQSYKTTMDMYGTISIDEMQEVAHDSSATTKETNTPWARCPCGPGL